jgi:hypothetical protein
MTEGRQNIHCHLAIEKKPSPSYTLQGGSKGSRLERGLSSSLRNNEVTFPYDVGEGPIMTNSDTFLKRRYQWGPSRKLESPSLEHSNKGSPSP